MAENAFMGDAETEAANPYVSKEEYLRRTEAEAAMKARLFEARSKIYLAFSTDAGKEALELICGTICEEGTSCYSDNPLDMARKAGRQEVAIALRKCMAAMGAAVGRAESETNAA